METISIEKIKEDLMLWSCEKALEHYEREYQIEEVMYLVAKSCSWHQDIFLKIWRVGMEINWQFCNGDGESHGLGIFEFDFERYDSFTERVSQVTMLLMDMYMRKTQNNIRHLLERYKIGFRSFKFKHDKMKIDFWMVEDSELFSAFILQLTKQTFTEDQLQDIIEDYDLDSEVFNMLS